MNAILHHLLLFLIVTISVTHITFASKSNGMKRGKRKKLRDTNLPVVSPWTRGAPLPYLSNCSYSIPEFECTKATSASGGYFFHGRDARLTTKDVQWLSGRRIAFVGDSMARNQFMSLQCLLQEHEPHTVDVSFHHSYWLVAHSLARPGAKTQLLDPSSISATLKDVLHGHRAQDCVVVSTSAWWGISDYALDSSLYAEGNISISETFQTATQTVLAALATEYLGTPVWRTMGATHFNTGSHLDGTCHQGEMSGEFKKGFAKIPMYQKKAVAAVAPAYAGRVGVLDVTQMTAFRHDAHPGDESRRRGANFDDCRHWCLPGVPDQWNNMLLRLWRDVAARGPKVG